MHVFQTVGSNMLASVESSLCPPLQEPLERQSSCTGPRAESHGACTCFRQACTRGPKRRPASTINSLHSILSSSASILALVILFKDLSAGKHRFEHGRFFCASTKPHGTHAYARTVTGCQVHIEWVQPCTITGCVHARTITECVHACTMTECVHACTIIIIYD